MSNVLIFVGKRVTSQLPPLIFQPSALLLAGVSKNGGTSEFRLSNPQGHATSSWQVGTQFLTLFQLRFVRDSMTLNVIISLTLDKFGAKLAFQQSQSGLGWFFV